MNEKIKEIIDEVKKAVSGKDDVIGHVLTAVLAGGHILLEDVPGVGKTTLALALSRALGLGFGRIQFTPDVVPSDITGFSIYDAKTGGFTFKEGAVMTNFFLADEINRTSSKTQSALLQVMQEGAVTVDKMTYKVPEPFIVMATQNPFGSAGTQMLPEAQLDRFMIMISMGYPDSDSQIEILKRRETEDPLDQIRRVSSAEQIVDMKDSVKRIYTDDKIYRYITSLAEASRANELVKLGISPRGVLQVAAMARAKAFVSGRDFVTPEDVQDIFTITARHRLILYPKAGLRNTAGEEILKGLLSEVTAPKI